MLCHFYFWKKNATIERWGDFQLVVTHMHSKHRINVRTPYKVTVYVGLGCHIHTHIIEFLCPNSHVQRFLSECGLLVPV